jgi:hypothetical protein
MFGGNTQGEQVARFLPNARCLGDILDAQGYTNVFLNGASLSFAGVGKFFRDHHYDKVIGREEWIGLDEKPETMSGWGLHDDDLFRRARQELAMLVKVGRPFNLNIHTIDTHHPYGQLSARCAQEGYMPEGVPGRPCPLPARGWRRRRGPRGLHVPHAPRDRPGRARRVSRLRDGPRAPHRVG